MDGIFVLLLYIYRIDLLPAMKISIVEELLEAFPDVRDLLIDGTERPIRRSKDDEKQKELTDDAKVERMILVEGVFRNKSNVMEQLFSLISDIITQASVVSTSKCRIIRCIDSIFVYIIGLTRH